MLVFDTLPGLFIGIAVSLLLLLYRASRPNVAVLGRVPGGGWADLARADGATPEPGVVVLRVEAGLFFANADHVRAAIRAHARVAGRPRGRARRARPCRTSTSRPRRCSRRSAASSSATASRLAIARDIGQVRDVLRETEGTTTPLFPTVEEAVRRVR